MVEFKCPACGEMQIVSDAEAKKGGTIACANCDKPVPLATPRQGTMMGMPPMLAKPGPRAIPDLPAPRPKTPAPLPFAPKPPAPSSLPAVAASPGPRLPSVASASGADLPAPRRTGDMPSGRGPHSPAAATADLPTPRRQEPSRSGTGIGLGPFAAAAGAPGAKPASTLMGTPAPSVIGGPKSAALEAPVTDDLEWNLAEPEPLMPELDDLMPRSLGSASPSGTQLEGLELGLLDLPTPHGGGEALPSPRGGGGVDLPTPHGGGEALPSPRGGGGVDLPSLRGGVDLPSPGGFISDVPTAKGAPLTANDDFFGDGGGLNLDDLNLGGGPAELGDALELDDLNLGSGSPSPGGAAALDLDSLSLERPSNKAESTEAGHAATMMPPVDRAPATPPARMPPAAPALGISEHDDDELELASPSKPAAAPPSFEKAPPRAPARTEPAGGAGLDLGLPTAPAGLSLQTERIGAPSTAAAPPDLGFGQTKHEFPDVNAVPASDANAEPTFGIGLSEAPNPAAPRRKRRALLAGGALVAVLLAGGGFFGYTKWQQAKQIEKSYESALREAKAAFEAADAQHWQRAIAQAKTAATVKMTAESLGIGAQAELAALLEEGVKEKERLAAATALLDRAREKGLAGRDLEIGQALRLLATRQTDLAMEKLAKIKPVDANVMLYQGWGHLQAGRFEEAIKAFDEAAKNVNRAVPAAYGRGLAHLSLGALDQARAAFQTVVEKQPEHIGAQIGLAAAVDEATAHTREGDLLAILDRKDLDKADARAIASAWVMVGDDARISGRGEAARDRYRKAIVLQPTDPDVARAMVELELLEGKPDRAAEELERALKISPTDPGLGLAAIELDLRRGKTADAGAKIAEWGAKEGSLTSLRHATKLVVLRAEWHEATGKPHEGLGQLQEHLVKRPSDFTAVMAAVALLGRMASAATDPAQAEAFRSKAKELVGPLEDRGSRDPTMGVALGLAFLVGGDPARAETWFRNVVAVRPTDTEAYFHLARALRAQKKDSESLSVLNKAFDLDPSRLDVGIELASNYEALGRMADAGSTFDRLLGARDVSIDLRGRAGRFYVRAGQIDRAAAQADAILAVDTQHAAGLYLRGVHLAQQGKLEEARRALNKAALLDPIAEYFNASAQVCERLAERSGDTNFSEEAVRNYQEARRREPTLRAALVGLGRILIARREAKKAVEPLEEANRLNPNDAEVWYLGGIAYQEMGKRDMAIAWMKNAIAARADNEADAWHRLAQLYYDTNKPSETTMAYTHATQAGLMLEKKNGVGSVPWLTDAYYKLGSLENDRGGKAAAKAAWTMYLARNPTNETQKNEVRRIMKGL